MKADNCPKCGQVSYIKSPGTRIYRDPGSIHIATENNNKCLDPQCAHSTEPERTYTPMGEYYKLPWWKRLITRKPKEDGSGGRIFL